MLCKRGDPYAVTRCKLYRLPRLSNLFNLYEHLAPIKIYRLIFHVVILKTQALALMNMENFPHVFIRKSPPDLISPGLWNSFDDTSIICSLLVHRCIL